MNFKKHFFLLACLLFTHVVSAMANEQSTETDNLIVLKPRACAVNKEMICSVAVHIVYRANTAACLYTLNDKLSCTKGAKEENYVYDYVGSESLSFALVAAHNGDVIAEAHLSVLQLAQFKRKQRNPWSFF